MSLDNGTSTTLLSKQTGLTVGLVSLLLGGAVYLTSTMTATSTQLDWMIKEVGFIVREEVRDAVTDVNKDILALRLEQERLKIRMEEVESRKQ